MLTKLSHIVTVLAFIFVPISLASSIFGMNVQQINQTGCSLWVFVITSIVLLTISALSFLFRHAVKSFLFIEVVSFVVSFVEWLLGCIFRVEQRWRRIRR
jgi:hypothetical protein